MSCNPKGDELECTCTNEHGQAIQCKDEDKPKNKPKPQPPQQQGNGNAGDSGNKQPPADTPPPPPATTPASSPAASKQNSGGGGFGVTYTPYRASGPCKNLDDMRKDFAPLAEYSTIRIYGVDCDQVSNALTLAKELNFNLSRYPLLCHPSETHSWLQIC